jgi:hypothetical protein
VHDYKKVLFPALRERRFVGGHRRHGHKVTHYSVPWRSQIARCYWRCDCGKRYWC